MRKRSNTMGTRYKMGFLLGLGGMAHGRDVNQMRRIPP